MLDFDLFGIDELEADAYSSAGYLMAILSFATLVPVYFFFIEPPKQATPPPGNFTIFLLYIFLSYFIYFGN